MLCRRESYSQGCPVLGSTEVSTAKSFPGRTSHNYSDACLIFHPQQGPILADFGPYEQMEVGVAEHMISSHVKWAVSRQDSRTRNAPWLPTVQATGGDKNGM